MNASPRRAGPGAKEPGLGPLHKQTQKLLPQAQVIRTDAVHFLPKEVPEIIAQAIEGVANKVRNR